MIYIILGVVAYIFFVLYDINSVVIKNKLLSCSFFAGVLLLAAATCGIILSSLGKIEWNIIRVGVYGAVSLVFIILLIYSLFFALPFEDTYLKMGTPPKVYRSGVYALCRHPGVICLIGFYLFLGLALGVNQLFIAAAIFSGFDILYVIFQDRWTFMKSFADYPEYKKDTPFLIPNRKSIKLCIQTFKWKEGSVNEL